MNRTKLLSLFAFALTAVLMTTGCGAGVDELAGDEQPDIGSTEEAAEPEVVSVSEQELTSVISCNRDSNQYCRSVGYSYSAYLAKCYWRGNYLVKTVVCR